MIEQKETVSKCKVSFSLVVYKQPVEKLRQAVASVLRCPLPKRLYIVDNSPTDEARGLQAMDACITYHRMPSNVGFGRAHNWAFEQAIALGSTYHYVVNPDIFYAHDVVAPMVAWLDAHPEVGQAMPKILYPDGRMQYLPKLMPHPLYLVQRKLGRLLPKQHRRWMRKFEMRFMRDDRVYDVGHVSGCFSVVRVEALRRCGLYDTRFFMYFEDTDLTRRLHRYYRTVYMPQVSVCHEYEHGVSKSCRLFLISLVSLIKFFNKWGWFADRDRKRHNRKFLSQDKD